MNRCMHPSCEQSTCVQEWGPTTPDTPGATHQVGQQAQPQRGGAEQQQGVHAQQVEQAAEEEEDWEEQKGG